MFPAVSPDAALPGAEPTAGRREGSKQWSRPGWPRAAQLGPCPRASLVLWVRLLERRPGHGVDAGRCQCVGGQERWIPQWLPRPASCHSRCGLDTVAAQASTGLSTRKGAVMPPLQNTPGPRGLAPPGPSPPLPLPAVLLLLSWTAVPQAPSSGFVPAPVCQDRRQYRGQHPTVCFGGGRAALAPVLSRPRLPHVWWVPLGGPSLGRDTADSFKWGGKDTRPPGPAGHVTEAVWGSDREDPALPAWQGHSLTSAVTVPRCEGQALRLPPSGALRGLAFLPAVCAVTRSQPGSDLRRSLLATPCPQV